MVKKIVITVHNPEAHEHSLGFNKIESFFYKKSHEIIVHTNNGADVLKKRTNNQVNVSVIPHGIDFTPTQSNFNFQNTIHNIGLDLNYKYILIFGNLRGYKGIELLLNAWEEVACSFPNVKLIIGGRLWSGQGVVSKTIASIIGTRQRSTALALKLDQLLLQKKIIYFQGFFT